jgi:Core-2/I-Branching enzyme
MRSVRIAYVISAYKRPEHLTRLVRQLHSGPETTFLVHVDRKTDAATSRAMVDGLADLEGVGFLPRHSCHWGGFGHVQASLKGIREVLRSGIEFDYVVVLSGQDYPIKPNAEIHGFLERGEGRSFLLYFPLPTENWSQGGLDRLHDWHLRYRGLHVHLPLRRRLPPHLRPWGGGAYWMASRSAVLTIARFLESNPWYVRFFRHVHIPDELFFQTILLNSTEAERCVNYVLHYTEWSRTPAPAILTSEDYPRFADSPSLFARKFDPAVDGGVLDMIDEGLLR